MKLLPAMTAITAFILCTVANARTLTVGIDASSSAPLLVSQEYADLAAANIASRIAAMKHGDYVVVQLFGTRTLSNLKVRRFQIGNRSRPNQVAAAVAKMIASIPASGLQGQSWTNITAFLEFGSFDCRSNSAVVLLSDGIESSPAFNESELISGKRALPAPESKSVRGCQLTVFGLGMTGRGALPLKQIKILRRAWESWANAAGAEFEAIILQ